MIILASGSPRRHELLQKLCKNFVVDNRKVEASLENFGRVDSFEDVIIFHVMPASLKPLLLQN